MKKFKPPNLVVIGAITLITTVIWVIFGVVRIVTVKEEPDVPANVILPLDPSLDTKTISELESRVFLSEPEIGETVIEEAPQEAEEIPEELLQELVDQAQEEVATQETQQATEEGNLTQ